jgi:hypothetical protein
MSWDQIEGNWKQAMAEVKQKWAKLTEFIRACKTAQSRTRQKVRSAGR